MRLMSRMRTKSGDKVIEFLADSKGKYRWRVTSRNGEIIGASSDRFASFQSCKRNLALLVLSVQEIAIEGWRE